MKGDGTCVDYGNWVSRKLVGGPLLIAAVFGLLAVLASPSRLGWFGPTTRVAFVVLAVFLVAVSLYFAYARHLFSDSGGGIQDAVLRLILASIHWDGRGTALDVGCGSGALAVRLAKAYKEAKVVGVDAWGGLWDYSRGRCQANAVAEGVGDRVSFEPGSASALPFPDESFDLVVSNLVFHEVRTCRNKRDLVREALRVAKKGSVFAFQDLFLIERFYGPIDDLLATIKGWGIQEVDFVRTNEDPLVPTALKLPFMLGTLGIIHGVK